MKKMRTLVYTLCLLCCSAWVPSALAGWTVWINLDVDIQDGAMTGDPYGDLGMYLEDGVSYWYRTGGPLADGAEILAPMYFYYSQDLSARFGYVYYPDPDSIPNLYDEYAWCADHCPEGNVSMVVDAEDPGYIPEPVYARPQT